MSNPLLKKKRGGTPNRRRDRALRRSELRIQVVERAGGRCEWAGCLLPGLHMAHISGSGLGGDPKGIRDTLHNTAFLCKFHHDMLDGRIRMSLYEVGELLRATIKDKGDAMSDDSSFPRRRPQLLGNVEADITPRDRERVVEFLRTLPNDTDDVDVDPFPHIRKPIRATIKDKEGTIE